MPIFFHNLKSYDAHMLIKYAKFSIENKGIQLSVIPQTGEKYLTLNLRWPISKNKAGKDQYFSVSFIDTFQFLNTSLKNLVDVQVKSYGAASFKRCAEHFSADKVHLFLRKGVYPYNYLSREEVLEDRQLPSKDAFFSDLENAGICDADYEHAQRVWREMRCQTLWDYTKLYLEADTLQLADIFSKHREAGFSRYGIEVAGYLSLPMYVWDAALKTSRVELEILTDFGMYNLIERSIRGKEEASFSLSLSEHAGSKQIFSRWGLLRHPATYRCAGQAERAPSLLRR